MQHAKFIKGTLSKSTKLAYATKIVFDYIFTPANEKKCRLLAEKIQGQASFSELRTHAMVPVTSMQCHRFQNTFAHLIFFPFSCREILSKLEICFYFASKRTRKSGKSKHKQKTQSCDLHPPCLHFI